MSELVTGTLLFKDLKSTYKNKRLFLLMGQLWIPTPGVTVKPEHIYKLVGSTFTVNEAELIQSLGLQILLNGGVDVSDKTEKKHPSQIVHILHTDRP